MRFWVSNCGQLGTLSERIVWFGGGQVMQEQDSCFMKRSCLRGEMNIVMWRERKGTGRMIPGIEAIIAFGVWGHRVRQISARAPEEQRRIGAEISPCGGGKVQWLMKALVAEFLMLLV